MSTKETTPKKFKTNIHAIFGTDRLQEEEGAWVTVNAFYGLRVKVRRYKSNAATRAYNALVAEHFGEGKLRSPKDLAEDEVEKVQNQHLAENILVDWENLRDTETGELIEYSKEAALEIISEVRDFRDFVFEAANERDTFREKLDEEAEGN